MYYFVENSIVVVKPKEPFLEWLNKNFTDSPVPLTLNSIRIDCNSYLISSINEIEDGVNYIDQRFTDIFAIELSSWIEDKEYWPEELSLKTFWEWFDIEVFPTLIDLGAHTEDNSAYIENTIH